RHGGLFSVDHRHGDAHRPGPSGPPAAAGSKHGGQLLADAARRGAAAGCPGTVRRHAAAAACVGRRMGGSLRSVFVALRASAYKAPPMRLTQHSDYAMRLLMYVGGHPDRLCTISEVARAYGISEPHLMKVTHRLSQHGWLETVRGKNGGMRLAMP